MPLLELWASNPATIDQFSIEQIVAAAGAGNLKDGADCSKELREYLLRVPSTKLAHYIDHCLTQHFTNSGFVLQDLINELGRRLDYKVTNGRYQGTTNAVGFDGIWISPEGHGIVIEVKTTDAYRISLDIIASYREKLLQASQISSPSSILIVVGRNETGEVEAQIRGSRHAWDMRLISADALTKLVQLKEDADGPETGRKIRSLLTPMEYTRLDQMIDVMFTTAKDVEGAAEAEAGKNEGPPDSESIGDRVKAARRFTDRALLQAKREQMVAALARQQGTNLIRKSRALYWDPSHSVRAAFTVSKRYTEKYVAPYWYAYHPDWNTFLGEGKSGFFVLGCMDLDKAFAIPLDVMRGTLDAMHTTELEDGSRYWHIYLNQAKSGEVVLSLPKRKATLGLSQYALELQKRV